MKGLLIEIDKKRRGIVLLADGNIVHQPLPKSHVFQIGQELDLPVSRINFTFHLKRRVVAGLLTLLLIVGPWSYAQTTSSVYIDVNPSIRLDVNFMNRIIAYEALNADGAVVLQQVSHLNNKSVHSGMLALMDALKHNGYIQDAQANRVYVSLTQNIKVPFVHMFSDIQGMLDEEVAHENDLSYVIQEYNERDEKTWKQSKVSPLRYEVEGNGTLEVLEKVFSDHSFEEEFHTVLDKTEGLKKEFNDFDDAFDHDDDEDEWINSVDPDSNSQIKNDTEESDKPNVSDSTNNDAETHEVEREDEDDD